MRGLARTLAFLLLVVPTALSFPDAAAVAAQADQLHDQGRYAEARTLLLDALPSVTDGKGQAELYWRASRETLDLGDAAEKEGRKQAELLAIFTEGEAYADKAIAADPGNDLGLYWKAANSGRWGQVKGILNALFKAAPIRDLLVKELAINPNRSDPYYVLGQLYRELPGWPASFGNTDVAVSLGHWAVDLRRAQVAAGTEKELVYNFMTELAQTLWKRNWSAQKRKAEQQAKAAKLASAATPLDKGSYYEGSVALPDQSDRAEARELVQGVIAALTGLPALTADQAKDLDKAREVLKGW